MWAAKVSITGFTATGATDLQTAKTALSGIIGHFELMDNFASIFSCDNKKNTEIIFAMPFIEGEASNDGGRFLYQDAVFLGQAYGRNGKVIEKDTLNLKGTGGVFRDEYTEDFWKTFKEGDSRRDATFMEYYMKNDNGTLSEFGCVMKNV